MRKNFPKADLTISTGRDGGRLIEVGQHLIDYSPNFTEFECNNCKSTLEVPEIFRESDKALLYQLFIFGKFRHNTCSKASSRKSIQTNRRTPYSGNGGNTNKGASYCPPTPQKSSNGKTWIENLVKGIKERT